MWLVGIDEAGRGPVIGPLVITIFACKEGKVEELRQQGVKDSKLLPSKRESNLQKYLPRMIHSIQRPPLFPHMK